MGFFDFLKKKTDAAVVRPKEQVVSFADKERIAVERITVEDMRKFTALPYAWSTPVKKFIQPHSHPFAYIDLVGQNLSIAKQELEGMNTHLSAAIKLSTRIPKNMQIPVNKIVFTPQKYHGYTRLMCTPYTASGEPSLYPASLSFMTDMSNDSTSTHGDLFYGPDGKIHKAQIYCWRKNNGYFFYYVTLDGVLTLEKIEINKEVIYKAPHILEMEAKRKQEEQDYAWLRSNIPDHCPKTLTGYRRMKTQNTKNYQTLKQLAAEQGKSI